MNPYQAYSKQRQSSGWTRIDLLLSLYDGAVDRIARAEKLLDRGERAVALPLLSRAQMIVSEIAAGVRVDLDEENGPNLLRLFEFVIHKLAQATAQAASEANQILKTLQEGFMAIRDESRMLERRGELPSAEVLRTVHATA